MRILMLCESYLSIGGVAEVVDNLAAEFAAMNHQVAVVSTPYQVVSRSRTPRSTAEHFALRIPRQRPFSWRYPLGILRATRAREFLALLREWRPDVVNFQGPLWERMPAAFAACRATGVPVVLTLHDLAGRISAGRSPADQDCDGVGESGEKGKRAIASAAALTFVSSATRASFAAIAPQAANGEVILNGVDCTAAERAAVFARSRPYLFCAARINLQHKAMDVLAQAFNQISAEYPELDLLLTGDGPDREELAQIVSSLGLSGRVHLLGVRPRNELWPLYKGATVFAMPSHKPEGLGLAFLESMACARPVIGTNSGGTPEIVRHGETGLLVEQNTPQLIASAIRKLLDNPAERERMGRAGHEMVNTRFSWPTVARNYLEVYRRTLSGNHP
ncbi:MAG TPA: glycosyltransferase family 4 protein [Candidatus Binataceae bacterium]|nr:glycosyltransferase family 4 protein [Candidatus Binataceae bacterium]